VARQMRVINNLSKQSQSVIIHELVNLIRSSLTQTQT
jgi:hypothetical protein